MLKLLFVLIVVPCISLSDACDCMPVVKKDAYCKSKYVGSIKVLNSGSSCDSAKICHSIGVVQRFRGAAITPTALLTADNSAACGVNLIKGHTYFVATNPIDSDTLGLNSCQLLEDWTGFTLFQLLMKKREYRGIECSEMDDIDHPIEVNHAIRTE